MKVRHRLLLELDPGHVGLGDEVWYIVRQLRPSAGWAPGCA